MGNNKRIAKNTIFLYIRMLITLFVTLYTSRIVLETLGFVDFGLYNLVGGIIILLSFITNSMASASQRFLAYDLGKKDFEKVNKTFSMTVTIYIIFIILTVIIAETIGLWFVTHELNIPNGRENAVFWVYQFSVLSFAANLIRIPYNSMIIAFEKMSFYSWVSVIEVILKLAIVYLLVLFSFDKLILYGVLTFFVISIITLVYYFYTKKIFPTCNYIFHWDKNMFLSIFKFAGWNIFGASSFTAMSQGTNILLNIFFNPTINAARAIAFQINGQIFSFVINFQLAVAPQLIKYYAAGENEAMKKLFYQSSKLSYYLLFIISLPLILEMDFVLKLWLKTVPDYTILFSRLVVFDSLIYCMAGTLIHLVQATGKNKYYEIGVGTILLLNLPISYLFLKMGYPPEITMIITIILSIAVLIFKLFFIKLKLNYSVLEYFNKIILRNIFISIISLILPLYIHLKLEENLINIFFVGFTSIISCLVCMYFIGLDRIEKDYFLSIIKRKINF